MPGWVGCFGSSFPYTALDDMDHRFGDQPPARTLPPDRPFDVTYHGWVRRGGTPIEPGVVRVMAHSRDAAWRYASVRVEEQHPGWRGRVTILVDSVEEVVE